MFNTEFMSLKNPTSPQLQVARFFKQYNHKVYKQVLLTAYIKLQRSTDLNSC